MAKLSARNRKEVWRMRKDFDLAAMEARNKYYNDRDKTDFENSWEKEFIEYAYMTDGHLLRHIVSWHREKLSYLYNPPRMIADRHDFGWKDLGKLEKNQIEEKAKFLLEKGYREV